MNSDHPDNQDRIFDLLASQATEGLSNIEEAELEVLLDQYPEYRDLALDEAAAALDLVFQATGTMTASDNSRTADFGSGLPDYLKERIANDSDRFLTISASPALNSTTTASSRSSSRTPKVTNVLPWLGWVVAAAVILLMLWNQWFEYRTSDADNPDPDKQIVDKGGVELPDNAKPTLAQRYRRLRQLPDTIVESTTGNTGMFAKAKATFVWNQEKREGYIKVEGVPRNDRKLKQYQLWIMDPSLPKDSNLVDGGVFDVTAKEQIIPMMPTLPIRKLPQAFAITREVPGGVVTSEQDELVVIAMVGKVA